MVRYLHHHNDNIDDEDYNMNAITKFAQMSMKV